MANHAPDRAGLQRYHFRRQLEADVTIQAAIARLSRRHDLRPAQALTVLADAIRPHGISKRTLQRYWQADIAALQKTLRQHYRPPAARRRARVLAALAASEEELKGHLEEIPSTRVPATPAILPVEAPQPTATRKVCIVHGRDELNAGKLEKLLRERWNLDAVVLNADAGRGRTRIERFEHEAQRATAALVLITPEDFSKGAGTTDSQARSNVLFELGWLSGRLGRQRVCILVKKGTKIPSDLDGMTRIEFRDSIDDKIIDIEQGLEGAGLL